MLQRLRQRLALVLLCLLPFHALAVTVLTKMIAGPGHSPMPILAGWKEALLGLILMIGFVEFCVGVKSEKLKVKNLFSIDLLDGLIFALLAIALVLPKTNFLFGFKYDFIPLIAFMILRRVSWSDRFKTRAESALLWVGGIVALYGIISFFLPDKFFYALGYSDAHSLYLPGRPLAAVQQISGMGIRRIQSVMSGPNQLGIWLLIPIAILLTRMCSEKLKVKSEKLFFANRFFIFHFSLFILLAIALVLTFSRSAWIAAFVITCIALYRVLPRRIHVEVIAIGVGLLAVMTVAVWLIVPSVLLRATSNAGHIERPLQAIQTIIGHPFGLGLGSAGPAANRTHDVCVFLSEGDDASWAADNTDLCVFAGKTQVTIGRVCDCPLIPENWYLQIGVELGVAGFLLYMTLIGMILWRQRKTDVVFLLFVGISIAALFLHAWEDAAVAYTGWIFVAFTANTIRKSRAQ